MFSLGSSLLCKQEGLSLVLQHSQKKKKVRHKGREPVSPAQWDLWDSCLANLVSR